MITTYCGKIVTLENQDHECECEKCEKLNNYLMTAPIAEEHKIKPLRREDFPK